MTTSVYSGSFIGMTNQSALFRQWLGELNMDPEQYDGIEIMARGTVVALDRLKNQQATPEQTVDFLNYLVGYTGIDQTPDPIIG